MSEIKALRQAMKASGTNTAEAARALGASTPRIMFRHLLPNSIGQLMVALSFAIIGAITAEATLSFFGYGPDLLLGCLQRIAQLFQRFVCHACPPTSRNLSHPV